MRRHTPSGKLDPSVLINAPGCGNPLGRVVSIVEAPTLDWIKA